jgi:hypothetical protein
VRTRRLFTFGYLESGWFFRCLRFIGSERVEVGLLIVRASLWGQDEDQIRLAGNTADVRRRGVLCPFVDPTTCTPNMTNFTVACPFDHLGNAPNATYAYNSTAGLKTIIQDTAGTWLFTPSGSAGPFNATNNSWTGSAISGSGTPISAAAVLRANLRAPYD